MAQQNNWVVTYTSVLSFSEDTYQDILSYHSIIIRFQLVLYSAESVRFFQRDLCICSYDYKLIEGENS